MLALTGVVLHRGVAVRRRSRARALLLFYEHALVGRGNLSRIDKAFFDMNAYVSLGFFALVLADEFVRVGTGGEPAPRHLAHIPSPSASVVAVVAPSASAARAAPSPSATAALPPNKPCSCRLTYGPVRQPFVGEVALAATDTGVSVVAQRGGVPIIRHVTASAPAVAVADAALPRAESPPCALAGSFSFCMDPAGAIHRRPVQAQEQDVVVARGRPGAAFAAELIDGDRVVLAFLVDHRTTEGVVSEAWAVLDDGPPLRLSEEGSGATSVALAPRAGSILALLLDGRVAMTPAHARTLVVADGKLRAGPDAVIFLGGEAEAHTRGVLGMSATGASFALIPIAAEAGFGLAAARVDDPPTIDEPVTWSLYPNGLDPAPIVATHGGPLRLARVRPLEARFDAPWGLELGALDDAGAFVSHGLVTSRGRVRTLAMAGGPAGTLWLAYGDETGTWLERRACP